MSSNMATLWADTFPCNRLPLKVGGRSGLRFPSQILICRKQAFATGHCSSSSHVTEPVEVEIQQKISNNFRWNGPRAEYYCYRMLDRLFPTPPI